MPPFPCDEEDWISIPSTSKPHAIPTTIPTESLPDRINRVSLDLRDLQAFYTLSSSPTTYDRLDTLYTNELDSLLLIPFTDLSTEDKADYLLLKNWLNRSRRNLAHARVKDATFTDYVEPFAAPLRKWIEKRMQVEKMEPQKVAESFHKTLNAVESCRALVEKQPKKYTPASAYRASKTVRQLLELLEEMYSFYSGYNPLWDWWVREPYERLRKALADLPNFYMEKIAGIAPDDTETIVGEPIGREALLTELEAEMIPYTPEELIRIAEKEYIWCWEQMTNASSELGFGKEWRKALEYVKTLYEPPGSQITFVKSLIDQGTEYVKRNDLVTVPKVAEEAIPMIMIPPAGQKISPFFLGGDIMQVAYPTSSMSHPEKLMSMRGNGRHLSKATAFHEMIPGHHLQGFFAERVKRHRQLFSTPFYVEGWAVYWEMVLWDRGDFFSSPEDRVGTMFWRMHRCIRIIFSLNFHLGKITPKECVDMLVNRVGHERSTAEGEVRRSCGEDYSPLYQAGYLLGALQLWQLREEVLATTKRDDPGRGGAEKEFHDRILGCNTMPIEMVRNIILRKDLSEDWKSSWKFYGDV